MKRLKTSDLKLVSGGLRQEGVDYKVSSEGIPKPIFDKIELSLQSWLDNKWTYSYSMTYLCANGCMPYYEAYKNHLWQAKFNQK